MEAGIVPLNLFKFRESLVSCSRFPMESGIGPLKAHPIRLLEKKTTKEKAIYKIMRLMELG
jgi:hypothetical protein